MQTIYQITLNIVCQRAKLPMNNYKNITDRNPQQQLSHSLQTGKPN